MYYDSLESIYRCLVEMEETEEGRGGVSVNQEQGQEQGEACVRDWGLAYLAHVKQSSGRAIQGRGGSILSWKSSRASGSLGCSCEAEFWNP